MSSILLASIPDTPSSPTVAIIGANVKISWSAVTDNGASISAYNVVIKCSDSTFSGESTYCASTATSVLTN